MVEALFDVSETHIVATVHAKATTAATGTNTITITTKHDCAGDDTEMKCVAMRVVTDVLPV